MRFLPPVAAAIFRSIAAKVFFIAKLGFICGLRVPRNQRGRPWRSRAPSCPVARTVRSLSLRQCLCPFRCGISGRLRRCCSHMSRCGHVSLRCFVSRSTPDWQVSTGFVGAIPPDVYADIIQQDQGTPSMNMDSNDVFIQSLPSQRRTSIASVVD